MRDIVIGMADGLTVPFALAAGLTGAVDASHLIVVAGLAEIAAGSIAMGLGGYLAARSDAEHYASERLREEREIVERLDDERQEVLEILESYGLTRARASADSGRVRAQSEGLGGLDDALRAGTGKAGARAAPCAARRPSPLSYIAGGLIPLAPYMLTPQARSALRYSVAATMMALAIFGYVKGRFTGVPPCRARCAPR